MKHDLSRSSGALMAIVLFFGRPRRQWSPTRAPRAGKIAELFRQIVAFLTGDARQNLLFVGLVYYCCASGGIT